MITTHSHATHHPPRHTGGGGGRKEEQEDSSSGSSDIDRERDPFGFRELKAKYGSGAKGGGDPDFPPVTADEAAAVEERLVSAGAVHVERNIFGVEKVTQEMAAGWEAGLLPPQLHARDTDQLMNRHMCVASWSFCGCLVAGGSRSDPIRYRLTCPL